MPGDVLRAAVVADVAVVIPYHGRTAGAAEQLAHRLGHRDGVEVILVGPGKEAVRRPGAGAIRNGVVHLEAPAGRGAGLRAALERVNAEVTVLQDADAAWPIEALDLLVGPIARDEADVVVARRSRLPLGERALAGLARWVSNAQVADPLSGQRAFRTEVLKELSLQHLGDDVDAELLVKLAAQLYRFKEVAIDSAPSGRGAGAWLSTGRTLLSYATMRNDADNAHEGYNTLARMEAGAPNYNAWLGARFREHAGQRVLEVGAGIGTITELLAEGREKVVALEVDEFYVRRLKNRFRNTPQVVPYLSDVALADWEKLKVERFDTVVLSNVLEHIPDDAGAVRRFAQIVGPGGKVLIVVPALPQLFGALDEAVGHYRRYTDATLRAVLEQNGFEIELLEWMNLAGIPGWFVNSRLFKRRAMPPLQLRIYDQVAPLVAKAEQLVKLPVGMSLFCVARTLSHGRG